MLSSEQKRKKQRLTRLIICLCALGIPFFIYVQRGLLRGELQGPLPSVVLIFALINLNALLLLLMLYLVLRNLAEIFFERRQRLLGSTLRSKLVASFVFLSVLPTTLLFFFATAFISTSMEYWFNAKVEQSLQASAKLAQSMLQETGQQAKYSARQLAALLETGVLNPQQKKELDTFFLHTLESGVPGAPDSLLLLNAQHDEVFFARSGRLLPIILPSVPSAALHQAALHQEAEVLIHHSPAGALVQAIAPVRLHAPLEQTWFLVSTLLIPSARLNEVHSIFQGLSGYRHLMIIKAPMKMSLHLLLVLVTLLVLFGAIWLGIYISRSLTSPIHELALATKRVAEGDLQVRIAKQSEDEMGMLVDSFNAMTEEIRASTDELAQAHQALQASNAVSEQRRKYLETILKNVAAGVIALDERGEITTINRYAEELLAIEPSRFIGRTFQDALPRQHARIVESFLNELLRTGKATVERHLRVIVRPGETLSLQVNVTRMVDDKGHAIGFVIVFDNLTHLEKAQRLAAWQEVARRIAHEIKNPLTPIQLSAQRLRKRFLKAMPQDEQIIEQCSATIIDQVEQLRSMVEEFSSFARMPKLNKKRQQLQDLVAGISLLYQESNKHLLIQTDLSSQMPAFAFDAVQIKRLLVNLLDNAIALLPPGAEQRADQGRIDIRLRLNEDRQRVRLEVADNGPGMSEEIRLRLFEPYFSTRSGGTGLGLAISHTIVTEHEGMIRAEDNRPCGTVFIVELPLAQEES